VTPEGKKVWAKLQRIVEKRGRTGKKKVLDDTRVKSKVKVMSKKGRRFFRRK